MSALAASCSAEPGWQQTSSGLLWRTVEPGTGPRLSPGDFATVSWLATKDDGTVFEDRRHDSPPTRIRVSAQVPKWWEEGLQLMQQGGRYEFRVPMQLMWPAATPLPALAGCTFVTYAVHLAMATSVPKFTRPDPARARDVAGFPCEVIVPGKGAPPTADHSCRLQFVCWDEEGGVVDSSFWQQEPLQRRIDAIPVPCLRTVLMQMAPGARWRCSTPVETGEPRWVSVLGAGKTLYWDIELLGSWPAPPTPAFQPPPPEAMRATASGLRIAFDRAEMEVRENGAGKRSQKVLAHFTTWLADGTLIEASQATGGPVELDLDRLPAGAREGFDLVAPGGAAWLRIPAPLGYGAEGSPAHQVPPGAELVVRLECVRRLP